MTDCKFPKRGHYANIGRKSSDLLLTGFSKSFCINRDDACLKTISDYQDTNGKGNSDEI